LLLDRNAAGHFLLAQQKIGVLYRHIAQNIYSKHLKKLFKSFIFSYPDWLGSRIKVVITEVSISFPFPHDIE
jgi:hypothetical protein